MKNSRSYIFFPIGLISLILLPIICIWYLNKINAFKEERCLTIAVSNKFWEELSLKEYGFRIYPKRNYIEIDLTGNENDDNIRLNFAELEIRQFVKIQDTINGIRFHFDDTAKYWTLIRAIDICNSEGANIYNFYGNDMWVFNLPKPKQTGIAIEPMFCGLMQIKPKPNMLLDTSRCIQQFIKENLKGLILYLIFSATTIYLFIKSRE